MVGSNYLSFSWDIIIFAPHSISNKDVYDKIILKFNQGIIRTEKLYSPDDDYPRFAISITKQARIICTATTINGSYSLVVLEENLEHKDFETLRSMTKGYVGDLLSKSTTATWINHKLPNLVTGALVNGKTIIYNRDQQHAQKKIQHSLEPRLYQDDLKVKAFSIKGDGGTGKTIMAFEILALAKALGMKAVYLTQSHKLLAVAKKMMVGDIAKTTSEDADVTDRDYSDDSGVKTTSVTQEIEFYTTRAFNVDSIFFYFTKFAEWKRRDAASTKDKLLVENAIKAVKTLDTQATAMATPDAVDAVASSSSSLTQELNPDLELLREAAIRSYLAGNAEKPESEWYKLSYFDQLVAEYIAYNVVGQERFVRWYSGHRTSKSLVSKALKGESITPAELYIELSKIDLSNISSIKSIGKKGSLYPALHDIKEGQSVISKIAIYYTHTLATEYKIDPILASDASALEAVAAEAQGAAPALEKAAATAVIVVDEAQNLSAAEINCIVSNAGPGSKIYLCSDGSQSIIDPFQLLEQRIFEATGHLPIVIAHFNKTERMPARAAEFAKKWLELKACFIGGKLGSEDSSSDVSMRLAAAAVEDRHEDEDYKEGSVQFIKAESGAFQELVLANQAEDAVLHWAIITFSKDGFASAQKQFPGAAVLAAEEVGGLEFENVVLYDPFSKASLGCDVSSVSTKCKEYIKYGEFGEFEISAPMHYPKDQSNIQYAVGFNKVFVGATRVTKNLYVFNPTPDTGKSKKDSAQDHYGFLSHISKKILSPESDGISRKPSSYKLTIDEFIEAGKAKFCDDSETVPPTILWLFIKSALQKINTANDLSAEMRHSHLETLKQLVKVYGSESIGMTDPACKQLASMHAESQAALDKIKAQEETAKAAKITAEIAAAKKLAQEEAAAIDSEAKASAQQSLEKETAQDNIEHLKTPLENIISIIPITKDRNQQVVSSLPASNTELIAQLYDACIRQNINALKACVRKGVDINASLTEVDLTALHLISRTDNLEMLQVLIDAKANIDAGDKRGNTALHGAAIGDSINVAKFLLAHGANINAVNKSRITPLHDAAFVSSIETIKFLINNGAVVNVFDSSGNTPIHNACHGPSIEIIKFLALNKADVNATNNQGVAPLHNLCVSGKNEYVEFLISAGANINIFCPSLGTPLHGACAHKKFQIAKMLLEAGANTEIAMAIDDCEATPLDIAIKNKDILMVSLLLSYGANNFNQSKIPSDTPKYITDMLGVVICSHTLLSDMQKNPSKPLELPKFETDKWPHFLLKRLASKLRFLLKDDASEHHTAVIESSVLFISHLYGVLRNHTNDEKTFGMMPLALDAIIRPLKEKINPQFLSAWHDFMTTKYVILDTIRHHILRYNENDARKLINENLEILNIAMNSHPSTLLTIAVLAATTSKQNDAIMRIVQVLLEAGANPNIADDILSTPLHIACIENSQELVSILLRFGANIDSLNSEGITPLEYCISNANTTPRMVSLFLQNGAIVRAELLGIGFRRLSVLKEDHIGLMVVVADTLDNQLLIESKRDLSKLHYLSTECGSVFVINRLMSKLRSILKDPAALVPKAALIEFAFKAMYSLYKKLTPEEKGAIIDFDKSIIMQYVVEHHVDLQSLYLGEEVGGDFLLFLGINPITEAPAAQEELVLLGRDTTEAL